MASAGPLDFLVFAYVMAVAFGFFLGLLLGGPERSGRFAWAMIGLFFPPALFVLFLRRARGRSGSGATMFEAADANAPPVPVPTERELLILEEPIAACPRCGLVVENAPLVAGACVRCADPRPPVVFASRDDYAMFVMGLHAAVATPR